MNIYIIHIINDNMENTTRFAYCQILEVYQYINIRTRTALTQGRTDHVLTFDLEL